MNKVVSSSSMTPAESGLNSDKGVDGRGACDMDAQEPLPGTTDEDPAATSQPSAAALPLPCARLQPVLENDTKSTASNDSDDSDQMSKVASFYIGGDDGFPPREHLTEHRTAAGQECRVIEFTPPDGGYGWVIALAACFINMWIIGFTKSYGVLYLEIRNAFPEATAYHTSWLPSLLSTVGLLTAPATGILCRRFTSRKVSFFGGILCCAGLLLGAVSTSMNQLILSVGVLTGFGCGLTTTSGILIVSLYFERRRSFASSICLSGNALGGFVMPPLVDYLLATYGLRGAFLILAGLQLNICVASMLLRPISHHAIVQAAQHRRQTTSEVKTDKAMMMQSYLKMENDERSELHRQVSFLRSASMMNSLPNLTLYARSWSVSGAHSIYDSRPSVRASIDAGSRSSLSKCTSSKWSLSKWPLFAQHPSVLRLSEDDGSERMTPAHAQHDSPHRLQYSRTSDRRASLSLSRQTSLRPIQSRIMVSVLEQDAEDGDETFQPMMPKNKEKEDETTRETQQDQEEVRQKGCCAECLEGLCDVSLFQDGLFWVVATSVFFLACGTPFYLFYFPSYAETINIPSSLTTSFLSVSAILDLIGRLGTGFVSDLGFFQLHHIYFTSSMVAGVAVLSLPHVTSEWVLAVVLCVLGFAVGSWFVMIPPLLAAHHGAAQLAASYGLVRLFNGIMNFISPQVNGLLFDLTQSYAVLFSFMGSSMVLGSSLVLLSPLLRLYRRRRRHNTTTTTTTSNTTNNNNNIYYGKHERRDDYLARLEKGS